MNKLLDCASVPAVQVLRCSSAAARDEGVGEMTFSAGTRSRNRHYLHDTLLICELDWTQLLGGVNGMVILASYIRSGQ